MSKRIYVSVSDLNRQLCDVVCQTVATQVFLKAHTSAQLCSVYVETWHNHDCSVTIKPGSDALAIAKAALEKAWRKDGFQIVWY